MGRDGWDFYLEPDYWRRRQTYLYAVADFLSDFNVEVLLFFRSRDTFAESMYQEVIKRRYWQGSFETFLVQFEPWFDYDRQMDAFKQAFCNVRVESYDDATRRGLLRVFFDAIGWAMPFGAETYWANPTKATNPLFASQAAREAFLLRYSV